ncbi:AFF-Like homolog [Caenorhabditis elegans]|uniref:AFF-Like homolog n=1 Tax=Caenorhabditis elegans TaxID=6239 RepID=Q95XW6_CAEEL|nr:AFF-Like homolog [Caenorhabditis elegans]CCD69162.1 AFF-Like homolog [Caenorhabditis elegans]|eukprot:NP_497200.2 Uncharacterized protein CELE_Y55B1BR.1 [Caenorhabditis elegans]
MKSGKPKLPHTSRSLSPVGCLRTRRMLEEMAGLVGTKPLSQLPRRFEDLQDDSTATSPSSDRWNWMEDEKSSYESLSLTPFSSVSPNTSKKSATGLETPKSAGNLHSQDRNLSCSKPKITPVWKAPSAFLKPWSPRKRFSSVETNPGTPRIYLPPPPRPPPVPPLSPPERPDIPHARVLPQRQKPTPKPDKEIRITVGFGEQVDLEPTFICKWNHARLRVAQEVPVPDLSQASEEEFYTNLAKEWKCQATLPNTNPIVRRLKFMISNVFYVLGAIARNDRKQTPASRQQLVEFYNDTYTMLKEALNQSVKDIITDTLAAHIFPRVKLISLVMLSVMQYRMYLIRSENTFKQMTRLESKEVAGFIENDLTAHGALEPLVVSVSSDVEWVSEVQKCQKFVAMPELVYQTYKSQFKSANKLFLASTHWEDFKVLLEYIDAGNFIKDIESVCKKPIAMDIPFENLATFVLTAVGSLMEEYEKEQKLPVKPVLEEVQMRFNLAKQFGAALESN